MYLDRIFDCQDVLVPLGVDLVDHGGQRRGLAAARRPCHQHQASRPIRQRRQDLRQGQLLEAADTLRDQAIHGGDRAALIEHVAPEAREPLDAEREVELERLLEALFLRVGEDAVGELLGLGRCELGELQPIELAADAHLRRRIGREMEV